MPSSAALLVAALVAVLLLSDVARAQTGRAASGTTTYGTAQLAVTGREVNWRRYAFNARFNAVSTSCGGNGVLVSSWVTTLEQYWARTGGNAQTVFNTASTSTVAAFNGGTWTCPVNGIYYISTFGRVRNSGHADLTIRIGGSANNRIAGWGTDIPARNSNMWLSGGVATVERLFLGETIGVYFESGSGNDCIWQPGPNTQNGDYDYNQFTIFLLWADSL